ncbi:hypothetical protein ASPACDRAFT_43020 [Aspergillus aculeatus ATCC 16872]|uniref:Invertebrate defensins family profile domain-containing protein n=1 Tax=Aspergillus aculeatus (strain ATCC 16872 / CBS 172.66 / WB 5094) TaxID=690307 RepID=A0A1L9WWC8_ASPA1|nr:uncharacterized protein ASPACDRAFT_43020 [Aspergillus aculeatus ATCC 16872]OJK00433.1 hypothetical protein ASPACDRAFT_43020 [Aspergillus aculeatus ATCC 16872]
MKLLAISTLCSLVLASAVPLASKSTALGVALAAAQKSCQTPGGIQIANLACRNTGGGWTGGFCDDQGICHCTFHNSDNDDGEGENEQAEHADAPAG